MRRRRYVWSLCRAANVQAETCIWLPCAPLVQLILYRLRFFTSLPVSNCVSLPLTLRAACLATAWQPYLAMSASSLDLDLQGKLHALHVALQGSAQMTCPPILHGSASHVPQRVRPSLLAVSAMKAVPGRTAAGELTLKHAVDVLLVSVFPFRLFLPYRLCQGASALLDRQCPCYRHAARREACSDSIVIATMSPMPACVLLAGPPAAMATACPLPCLHADCL